MNRGEASAIFLFYLSVTGGFCAFFDLTDVDDPLALLWSTPNNVVNQQQSLCNVNSNGEITQGVCKSRTECLLTGGTPRGFCGLLSACCLYTKSCGKTSGSKISYFTSEGYTTETQCGFRVRLLNQRICQIRIDFHSLNLEPPILQSTAAVYVCEERFEVSPPKSGVPAICGSNDGQHMYIEVNGTQDKYVSMNIFLKPRIAGDRKPRWNIEITQLECPGLRSFIAKTDNHAAQDFPLIAPRYALQYFTERTGVIRSFGFDTVNSVNKYASNQYYTIAFKRGPLDCGMEFTIQFLRLKTAGPQPAPGLNCVDYIFIPGELQTNKLCEPPGERIIVRMPGPFYIYFFASSSTSWIAPGETENEGFQIYYNFTGCPRLNIN